MGALLKFSGFSTLLSPKDPPLIISNWLLPESECRANAWLTEYLFIAASLQTGLIQKFFIVRVLGKEEVGHEPRLVPCWTLLVINSLGAM